MYLFDNVYTAYRDTDAKTKTIMREKNYRNIILNSLPEVNTSDLPYDVYNMLERNLIAHGYACLGYLGDEIVVAMPSELKEISNNGFPICTKAITINGETLDEFVLIGNNSDFDNDMQYVIRYGYQLANVDESQLRLTKKSMCNPIPFASTNAIKDAIKKALRNSGADEGEDIVIMKNNALDGDRKDFDILDLTNIAYADKFKYLSAYHDDLTRRLFFLFGVATQSPTKQAQTNDSELENRQVASLVYVTNRLKARQDGIRRFNELRGTNYYYDFSDLIKSQNGASYRDTDNEIETEGGEES